MWCYLRYYFLCLFSVFGNWRNREHGTRTVVKWEPCIPLECTFSVANVTLKNPFCGATDTPVLDFWWCLLWVSKPEWAALFTLERGICVTCSLRFTCGVTPANLLAASMVAEPLFSTYLWLGIGGAQTGDLSCHRQRLCRLSYAGSTYFTFLTVGKFFNFLVM